MFLKQNDSILFQGDSITDVDRTYGTAEGLGSGYPSMVAAYLSAVYPEMKFQFLNRAVGGDAIQDIACRWDRDCIALNPTVVSILAGINDTWNHAGKDTHEPVAEFKEKYRSILSMVKEKLDARIMIMEPYVLPFPEDRKSWRSDLEPKIHAIRELAREFEALFIPLDGILNAVAIKTSPQFLTGSDGVHPTVAGHGVIAKAWLEATGSIK